MSLRTTAIEQTIKGVQALVALRPFKATDTLVQFLQVYDSTVLTGGLFIITFKIPRVILV